MSEYIPGDPNRGREPYEQGYSYGNYQNEQSYDYRQPAPAWQPAKRKRKTAGIVALCLACVILLGAAGVGTGVLIASLNRTEVSEAGSGIGSTPETPAEPAAPSLDTRIVNGSGVNSVKASYTGEVLSASEIYQTAVNACVGVKTSVTTTNVFGQVTSGAISGSGFIISSDGYILTNYHVVETADKQGLEVTVSLYNGEEYTASIIGKDADNDVALLKIEGNSLPTVVINASGDLLVGQTVYAIGNPLGELTYSMSNGIVSALDREIPVESNVTINMFQTTAAINSGNSGGPVLNDRGEVIGIASAKYASTGVEGLGFAIPIEDAMNIVDDLIQYGYVRGKPYFGVTVRTITASVADYYGWVEGAYVAAVDERSCAATAGLKQGDIITKVDEIAIASSSDLIKAKKNYTAGDTVTLTVYRGGEYLQMVLTFDEEGARAAR